MFLLYAEEISCTFPRGNLFLTLQRYGHLCDTFTAHDHWCSVWCIPPTPYKHKIFLRNHTFKRFAKHRETSIPFLSSHYFDISGLSFGGRGERVKRLGRLGLEVRKKKININNWKHVLFLETYDAGQQKNDQNISTNCR